SPLPSTLSLNTLSFLFPSFTPSFHLLPLPPQVPFPGGCALVRMHAVSPPGGAVSLYARGYSAVCRGIGETRVRLVAGVRFAVYGTGSPESVWARGASLPGCHQREHLVHRYTFLSHYHGGLYYPGKG